MLTHPSSWSNRAQRDHAAATGRTAWQTDDPALAARIEAALAAVLDMFPYLTREAVLDPPHAWFDAALARQVLCWTLWSAFGVPKRQISAVSLLNLGRLVTGAQTIRARMEDPAFAAALQRADILAHITFGSQA